jgi:hypothetical protein
MYKLQSRAFQARSIIGVAWKGDFYRQMSLTPQGLTPAPP